MKQLNKNNINFLYSESLEELAIETIKLLVLKQQEYKEFFNIENIEEIRVNYFDKLEYFRKFIYELRGEKTSLPEYATGTYDQGMINAFIDSKTQMNRLYTASHEFFHILYMRYVLKNDYSKRIVWYDEGMAQFMSGEKKKISSDEEFNNFYHKVKEQMKLIPKMNEIVHGNSFCNENYNGYDLSYLAICYLQETLTNEEFKNLMSNFEKIKLYGNTIVNDMFKYYDNKLAIIKVK